MEPRRIGKKARAAIKGHLEFAEACRKEDRGGELMRFDSIDLSRIRTVSLSGTGRTR